LALAAAVGYYLAARLGFVLSFPPATTSVLWPPNPLLTAALLLTPRRLWWVYLVAVLPAHLLVEAQAGFPASLVLALFVTNCSEAFLAAALLHRWSDAPTRFDSLRRITTFLAAAVVAAPALTSFADAGVVHWLRGEDYWHVFRTRLFSNALSALTIVPSVVTVVRRGAGWLRESSAWRRLRRACWLPSYRGSGTVFSSQHTCVQPARSPTPCSRFSSLPSCGPPSASGREAPARSLATSFAAIRAATLG
jgi:integral membrane sensor domain MASE1